MKSRRGAALAGAIILCSLIITVSFAISAVFLNISSDNIVRRVENQRSLDYAQAFNRFKAGEDLDLSAKYRAEVYAKEDTNVKALVIKGSSSGTMLFYAIYDFDLEHEKNTLAYQESHFDVKYIEEKLYLGGIGPFELVEEE